MKIVLTGSLGHISKPLAEELIQNGHNITIISSSPERQDEIRSLGATAAIGSLEDVDFLTKTFAGADAAYTMVPPNNYSDPDLDLLDYYQRLGRNYAQAILASGVKRVVNLSTFGAHLSEGNGILIGAHHVELILNALPAEISITHMRPTSFFYNLYAYTYTIKSAGLIAVNYGGDHVIPWVSPIDIAAAVAEEIQKPTAERSVRYVASEELTGVQTADILGEAIGKPDLRWVVIPDSEALQNLENIGMNKRIAAGMVEMFGALHSGLLAEDYYKHRPAVLGKVKLADFAQEFAAAFNQNN